MSRYYKQLQPKDSGRTRHRLNQRLARKEMGDEEYEKMIAGSDDGTFRKVGFVLIAIFAAVIFAVVMSEG